jgi:hypothetical protein
MKILVNLEGIISKLSMVGAVALYCFTRLRLGESETRTQLDHPERGLSLIIDNRIVIG